MFYCTDPSYEPLGSSAICGNLFSLYLLADQSFSRLEAIAIRLEAIGIRLEAIASRLEAIAIRIIRFLLLLGWRQSLVYTFPFTI